LQRQAVRLVRLSTGAALLLLGVVGGFVPILQGWVFIVAGLTVLAPESATARRVLEWAKRRLQGDSGA